MKTFRFWATVFVGIAFLVFGIVALASDRPSHTQTIITSVLGFVAVAAMIILFSRGSLTRWRLRREATRTRAALRQVD